MIPQVPWVRKGLSHLLTHTSVCVGWPEGRAGVRQSSRCGELVGVGFTPIMVTLWGGTHARARLAAVPQG